MKTMRDLKAIFGLLREVLDRFTPRKHKYIQRNNTPFKNKNLSKEIRKKPKLRNEFLKSESNEDRKRYTKERNLCVSLLSKNKKNYYRNFIEKNVKQ